MSIFEIVKQVLASWQVIAVTLVIFIYFFIVSHAARRYRRPRSSKKRSVNLFKKKKSAEALNTSVEINSDSSSNDELGLEEA
jgi:flagellar biosynthesis/type III secretory pathway M-ring protein FliF/YscJ